MNKISVLLLTCDRFNLTKKTVESFLALNNRDNFDLYYGDDGSVSNKTHKFMKQMNIPCLVKHNEKIGCSQTTEELVCKGIENSDNEFVLYLQNDFESVRPVDLVLIEKIFEDQEIGWIKLSGIYWNNRDEQEESSYCTINKRLPGAPEIDWQPYEIIDQEQLEIAKAPWTHHPTISRRAVLREVVRNIQSEQDAIDNVLSLDVKCVRVMDNITNHIGFDGSTPGGKFGKIVKWERAYLKPIETQLKRALKAVGLKKSA